MIFPSPLSDCSIERELVLVRRTLQHEVDVEDAHRCTVRWTVSLSPEGAGTTHPVRRARCNN